MPGRPQTELRRASAFLSLQPTRREHTHQGRTYQKSKQTQQKHHTTGVWWLKESPIHESLTLCEVMKQADKQGEFGSSNAGYTS